MVIGGKMSDDRAERRSRGPSPNRNSRMSEESSDSDDFSDSDGGMRVGKDYQAQIPAHNPDLKPEARAEAMLVWAPHPDVPSSKIDEYLSVAKERHGYNMEQSLGMLFWHKHHIEKSLTDLANFTPFPDEWTVEDKVLFEQAFSFHGKSFQRIRQMLPDKSIAQLVKYYYSWKKTRSRTSLMDRQARKIVAKDESDEDSGSESDVDSKDLSKKEYLKNSGRPGPASKKLEFHPRNKRHKKKPPRGMYLVQEDLLALATGPPGQGDALLKQLDAELVQLKRTVQNNKQLISMHKQKSHGGIDSHRLPSVQQKIVPKWTNEELLMAVQGIKKYGKDFKAVAEVLENKTESHVRHFFVNYRRRYNLDEVVAHYEKENGIAPEKRRKSDNDEADMSNGSEEKADNGCDENQVPEVSEGSDVDSPDMTTTLEPSSPSKLPPLKTNENKGNQMFKTTPVSPSHKSESKAQQKTPESLASSS